MTTFGPDQSGHIKRVVVGWVSRVEVVVEAIAVVVVEVRGT